MRTIIKQIILIIADVNTSINTNINVENIYFQVTRLPLTLLLVIKLILAPLLAEQFYRSIERCKLEGPNVTANGNAS